MTGTTAQESIALSNASNMSRQDILLSCKKCTNGNKVTVEFSDATFTFHAQWLHDSRCDDGPSKNATTAICEQPLSTVRVKTVQTSGLGIHMTLDVSWDDGLESKFPASWLRVMASLVARIDQPARKHSIPNGWLVDTLKIPEISYKELFREGLTQEQLDDVTVNVLDKVLGASSSEPGIVKIIDLPDPNLENERNHRDNLVTEVLKRLFRSVFMHPIRGSDQTFNVSSHSDDARRAVGVPNYDTSQALLPHSDHAFYDNPIQVEGFYCLEGESENTWVSVFAALTSLREVSPQSYEYLCKTPMAFGRVSRFYGDPLYQATVDTAVSMQPGSDQVKRVRWHPNLTGSLLAPYDDYKEARLAHQKFQEILRRDTHQLKLIFKPGDLYVWDNFRVLHGRERVFKVPRTGVGQTVPEQVVHDRYRDLHINMLKKYGINEDWLIHMPMPQLREMLKLMKEHY
ncbi:hypothetical protein MMC18_005765 [Xylographa bjoerkii]|nr:hypothetical protein [Xylographa bjoerkii]